MSANEIVFPIVHLNGDSYETLYSQLAQMRTKTRDALNTLSEHPPHPRNYYLKDGLFELAQIQHRDRILMLNKVLESLNAELIAFDDENK